MILHTIEPLTFTVSLALEAHAKAEQFCRRQSNPRKAKQVYLNTLAVYAVNFYLQCQGLETDLTQSDSWNPLMQTLLDVADLQVKNRGKLECRPVLPGSQVCHVPPEVGSERIGYVAVQLSESLREATLLGFVPAVATKELPLSQMRSLEDLREHINQLGQPQPVVQLSQWLHNIIDAGWETVEALLVPQELAFGFRSSHRMKTSSLANPADGVKRGKLLDLERAGEQVALFVKLKATESSEMDISVEVYPTGGQTSLPQDLQLMVLDEEGEAVMQAQARSTENIQLEFSGETGERFGIRVELGGVSITESFLI